MLIITTLAGILLTYLITKNRYEEKIMNTANNINNTMQVRGNVYKIKLIKESGENDIL